MTVVPFRTYVASPVAEGASPRLTATVLDDAGAPLAGSLLTTVTLTLYDLASGTIVNDRDHVDISTLVSEAGALVWEGEADDTLLVDADVQVEVRVVLIEWTWGAAKAGRHEIFFDVRNLGQVPVAVP